MSRNRRAWVSMPLSVASRSMLEAPKKPAMPVVRARTYSASSGSAIGPPWQRTMMSERTARAASCIFCTRRADSSSVSAVLAPIDPLVVRPRCATSTSAPALAIALALSPSNT